MCARLVNPRSYPASLREQALADWQCAEQLLTATMHTDAGVAKLSQALEKALKAYMLHELGDAFNPFAGHTVIRDWLHGRGKSSRCLKRLMALVEPQLKKKLEELEALAPRGREGMQVDPETDCVVALARNTEYPFHGVGEPIRIPCREFAPQEAANLRRGVRSFLQVLGSAPPYDFTGPIAEALSTK